MREILFRGKRIDNGEWIEGFYCQTADESNGGAKVKHVIVVPTFLVQKGFLMYEVDPSTIGQYTGLTDKNGKKIFEGDIVSRVSYVGTGYREEQGEVVYRAPEFLVDCKHHRVMIFSQYAAENKDLEIIGNIYDNPELLEDNT